MKISKNRSKYYQNMIIRMDEDRFAENPQSISKSYHELLLLINFSQTKPRIKKMKINFYELYYTVIKNTNEKENVDDQYEKYFNKFTDINPNRYVGRKNNIEILT